MEKIIALIIVNIVLIGMGLLIYSGFLDSVLTISYEKTEFEKKKIDYRSYRRTAFIILIIIDVFASVFIFTGI